MRQFLLIIMTLIALSGCASESCDKDVINILNPNQTSAKLLMDYAKTAVCKTDSTDIAKPTTVEEERKLVLIYDLYVKARSYAILNKVFFWLSLISAVAVFLWPALGVLLKERLGEREWYKSAIVQTTVTGIAALMFAFYSQYKDKQTYTENLMRYAVFSDKPVDELSQKVIEEIGKIDIGFSFSGVFDKKEDK
ncbi:MULTISPECIES: hypothetical protein [Methylomonas]|uniref:Uncharacterized protein n=2 Tax=Methylomonas TaxID=416 RepID=A0A126T7Z5_9GAMM|nr:MULTISPECIES: hypothetical protein [Methylomonas]AMK78160.1 hypothetical protein JT25_017000 [Methylomonas denitrificans]OAI03883.1 hypothetical protein A1342_04935 [Methylomonas methanica]TCV87812.1 hypothetical protein EDE11_102317 [Methylomonas methanica]